MSAQNKRTTRPNTELNNTQRAQVPLSLSGRIDQISLMSTAPTGQDHLAALARGRALALDDLIAARGVRTISALALAARVCRYTVYRLLHVGETTPMTASKLARALGVDVAALTDALDLTVVETRGGRREVQP